MRSWEASCSSGDHDLPLVLGLDPGNGSDFTASLRAYDRLTKMLKARPETAGWRVAYYIADAGHDAEPIYRYFIERGVRPIIPLKSDARATHPTRPEVQLSQRGVPLCQAGCEMAHWGSAGKGRVNFMCPLKANKIARCPLAPEGHPDWHCRPDLKWGPTTTVKVADNPRLFPPLPRNSVGYQRLYKLRSGCERSNAEKKAKFRLEAARHRRASFWLVRLHLIALLQHARAWVAEESAAELVDFLLGREPARKAA